jgi:hypothetical protein
LVAYKPGAGPPDHIVYVQFSPLAASQCIDTGLDIGAQREASGRTPKAVVRFFSWSASGSVATSTRAS